MMTNESTRPTIIAGTTSAQTLTVELNMNQMVASADRIPTPRTVAVLVMTSSRVR